MRSRSPARRSGGYSSTYLCAPRQTPDACARACTRHRRSAEHLSLYQLTIEQDTPFAALHAAGKLVTRTTIARASSTT